MRKGIVCLVAVVGLSACSPIAGNTGDLKVVTGTIRYYSIEGGFFALRGNDSVTYDPTNLQKSLQIDGLRVQAKIRLRNDLGGTHMVGPIVDIISLTTLDPVALR